MQLHQESLITQINRRAVNIYYYTRLCGQCITKWTPIYEFYPAAAFNFVISNVEPVCDFQIIIFSIIVTSINRETKNKYIQYSVVFIRNPTIYTIQKL